MSADAPDELEVAEPVVTTRRRPSIVWLIPVVAAIVGAFVAWRTFSERGPEIEIQFETAEGLEAGTTQIKYKDVEVGIVEEIHLRDDLGGVHCKARMVKSFEPYLNEGTRFWVVRPRVAGGQVTGLGTLFSGSYIGVDPVRDGRRAREFAGLDTPPIVTAGSPVSYVTRWMYPGPPCRVSPGCRWSGRWSRPYTMRSSRTPPAATASPTPEMKWSWNPVPCPGIHESTHASMRSSS